MTGPFDFGAYPSRSTGAPLRHRPRTDASGTGLRGRRTCRTPINPLHSGRGDPLNVGRHGGGAVHFGEDARVEEDGAVRGVEQVGGGTYFGRDFLS